MTPNQRLITNLLLTWIAEVTNISVGDHEAPSGDSYPYYILYTIRGGEFGGPIWTELEEASYVYQLNSVGRRRDQAQLAADRARGHFFKVLPSGPVVPAPAGWKVNRVEPDGGPPDVDQTGSNPNKVWTVAERFVLTLTPIKEGSS